MGFETATAFALRAALVTSFWGLTYSQLTTSDTYLATLDSSLVFGETTAQIPTVVEFQEANNELRRARTACQRIHSETENAYYTHNSAGYDALRTDYWSKTCWLEPMCIIQPTTAAQVSEILKIVTEVGAPFSTVSGKHNPNAGFASNHNGILIDLSALNSIVLSDDGSWVSIGPGNQWRRVYETLDTHNKSVIGARVTDVGVGGFLLGGGLSHLVSWYGLAASNVRNYEVVLANSSIVNANQETHSELFQVLQGGGANFGIVTRFDINTVPNNLVWYEGHIYNGTQIAALISAMVEYSKAAELDDKATISFMMTSDIALLVMIYNAPVERPGIFQSFYSIPPRTTLFPSALVPLNKAYEAISVITPLAPERRIIGSMNLETDNTTLQAVFSTFVHRSAEAKVGFGGNMAFVIQPVTTSGMRTISRANGDLLGAPIVPQSWISYSMTWPDDTAIDAKALNISQFYEDEFITVARDTGKHIDFLFMNDAGFNQDVLSSYGATALSRMSAVSHAYDPEQVFQNLQNGGFLLKDSL